MTKILTNGLCLLMLMLTCSLHAQKKTITGVISDSENAIPLPGASVLIKGTSLGVSTDFDGNYSIKANDNDILIISFVGYKTKEIPLHGENTINISLSPDLNNLGEVIVVGYGTQKKVNVTGAISQIEAKEIVKSNAVTLSSSLAGRLAGVTTQQSSGEPGSDSSQFRIRGLSSPNDGGPLVLVDGIERSMNDVAPNDVQSISVLKDAAASAIYGMRAANGVVLITTKRGKAGKPIFNLNINSGVQQVTSVPDFLDSYDFATLWNEANRNDGDGERFTQEDLDKYRSGSHPDTHPNTDWVGETLNDLANKTSINLSASGASKNEGVKYYTSLGYVDQKGLYDKNGYDRFNFRANLDIKASKSITFRTDFSGLLENKNRPGVSAGSLFSKVYRTPPIVVNQWSNGGYSAESVMPSILGSSFNEEDKFKFNSKIAIDIDLKFIEGLKLTTQVAYDYEGRRGKNFSVPNTFYTFDEGSNTFTESTGADRNQKATLGEGYSNKNKTTFEIILNYAKTVGNHDFGTTLVYTQAKDDNYGLGGGIRDLLGTTTPFFVAGDAETRTLSNGRTRKSRVGYAGRFTYGYQQKYLLEFNGRYDGSWKWGPGKKFGFFPSVSVAWNMGKEDFLKDSDLISKLKLRGSYGELGNDGKDNVIFPYRHLEFYDFSGIFIDDGSPSQAINSTGLSDPNTTWEKATSRNIGLELGLWKNMVTLETDFFSKTTTDVLGTRGLAVPTEAGANPPLENFGQIDNKGYEITINHRNVINDDLSYSMSVNYSNVKNKVIERGEPDDVLDLFKRTGRSLGTKFGLVAEGLYLTQQEIDDLNANAVAVSGDPGAVYDKNSKMRPGDIRYKDANGDGLISDADRTVIGRSIIPQVTYGITAGLDYKQWDLSLLFQGAAKFDVYLTHESAFAFFNGGKVFDRHLDRAQIGDDGNVINTDATYPRLSFNNGRNETTSSYWVQKGDYLRLKNIELGYSLPESVTTKLGLDKFRLYFNGRNLITWTGVKGVDPEKPQSRGWFYPQQRVYSLGLNLQF